MRAEIDPFQAIAISLLAHQLQAQGRSVIHMEFGQPSTGAPAKAIAIAHKILDSDPLGYWESPQLRAGLARHYAETYDVAVDQSRFVITCGASPALVLALTATFHPGDRIALARPGYVAYRNTLKALGLVPVEIPCGPDVRFQLNADALSRLDPAPAGVIIASPANPTGTIIDPSEMLRIAQLCRDRHIQIISDEIYHGLSYGEPARSMLEFEPSTLVINSFSKYFSMVGWRLGWLVAPAAQLARVRAFSGNMFLSAPSLSQHAALAALDCLEELDRNLDVYRRNRDILLAALPSFGLSQIAPPDGAFYVYANIGHLTNDSMSFCKRLLADTGVATAPGVDFDPVDGHHHIRMSFAVSTAEVEEAIARMTPWFVDASVQAGL